MLEDAMLSNYTLICVMLFPFQLQNMTGDSRLRAFEACVETSLSRILVSTPPFMSGPAVKARRTWVNAKESLKRQYLYLTTDEGTDRRAMSIGCS